MSDAKPNARWPIPEVIALAIFPVSFVGPDAIQVMLGRLPEFIQMVAPFLLSGFAAVSAFLLAVRAVNHKQWWHSIACIVCSVGGLLDLAYSAGVMIALGFDVPLIVGAMIVGLVIAGGMTAITQFDACCPKTRAT